MDSSEAKPIVTYVFFDLETTGLPSKKDGVPDITELSMVAVNRGQFLNTSPGELPRVQHRLLLCFKPKKEMSEKSKELSVLNESLLEQEPPFDKDTCDVITGFINRLPKPVCLVAHNGFTFHLAILKYYMQSNGAEMGTGVKCTDSLYAFYDIFNSSNDFFNNGQVETKTYEELERRYYYISPVIGESEYNGISYQLKDIYVREIEIPLSDCSVAQRQSLMMLNLALKRKCFVQWVDQNHCNYSDVPNRPNCQ